MSPRRLPLLPTFVAVLAIAVLGVAAWYLRDVVLMTFAAILCAIILVAAADALRRVAPVGHATAVGVAAALGLLALVGLATLLGRQTLAELNQVVADVPRALDELPWIDPGTLQDLLREGLDRLLESGSMMANITAATSLVVSVVTGIFVVLAAGLFLALSPSRYVDAAVSVLPARARPRARHTLEATGRTLLLWLLGKLVAMVVVGLVTTGGLLLLGVPSAVALGLIAGLLEFIPYAGPIIGAVPAVAVALLDSPATAFHVVLLYFVVQQLEGAVLNPLIYQRMVDLPAAITIFALIALGLLLGPLGLLLAGPITVVAATMIRELWLPMMDAETQAASGDAAGPPPPREVARREG